ncbi:hypothetical protein [Bythopirellula polymerisocia]|uniref:Uncharacterized protein n=1 Tax=Bythopirellula polymerisocia TaxID=2528003 RepID=A0A5C6D0Z4_9BACT|nr:hypothetical protein [Bythopirellula polymerisocia]TWU30398.1 hypothetical protein Pla144_11840 [Bythopirellula polymerisocia]
MNRLFLTAEQSSQLASAISPIEVFDPQGRILGTLSLTDFATDETQVFTKEEVAEVKRRLESAHRDRTPAFTAEQIRPRVPSQE